MNLTCAFLVAALVGANAYAGGRPDSSSRDWFGHINGVGLGYSFPNTAGRGYVEQRYERVEFENEGIEYIPLTIGYRW